MENQTIRLERVEFFTDDMHRSIYPFSKGLSSRGNVVGKPHRGNYKLPKTNIPGMIKRNSLR